MVIAAVKSDFAAAMISYALLSMRKEIILMFAIVSPLIFLFLLGHYFPVKYEVSVLSGGSDSWIRKDSPQAPALKPGTKLPDTKANRSFHPPCDPDIEECE